MPPMDRSRCNAFSIMVLVALWPATILSEETSDDSTSAAAPAAAEKQLQRNHDTATKQTVEVVRWVGRRRQFSLNGIPYGFTGLPIVYFSPNTGWNYGARVQWSDYRRRPYRYKFTFNTLRSDEGGASYSVRLKVPRIKGTGFGVRLLAGTRKDIRTRYYGLGNDSKFVKAYTEDEDHPEYRDENYYHYVLETPRFIFSLLREIEGPVSMSVGFGLENTSVATRGDRSILVDQGFPDDVTDGWTGFVSFTLQWDSRDDVVIARSGTFHEWSYETSKNSLLALHPSFEDIDFRRYTFTDARYRRLTSRVNLAHRTVFETLDGSVPLYAYGQIGGSRRIKGLGGSDSLRGFDRQRFTDDVRFFTNTEFRYHISTYRVLKQYLEWHVASFFDTGRVWRDVGRFGLSGFHATAGAGLRLYWNSDFVVRVDFGSSREQRYFGLKYRNIF